MIKATGKEKNYKLIEYVNDVNREYAEVLMELNINGIMDTAYSYGNEPLTNERFNGWTGYYTYDPRGSVSGVTDSEGMIWQSYRYDGYGNITFGKPEYNNVYAYNAESYNPNVDVQYLRARYYCPTTADFLTEDSYLGNISDPLTLNRYNYVKSSPSNYTDPSGHYTKREGKVAHAQMQLLFLNSYGNGKNRIPYLRSGNIYGSFTTKSMYGNVEVLLQGAGKLGTNGRADMILYNNNIAQVYEIKPDTYYIKASSRKSGEEQLNRYINAIRAQGMNAEYGKEKYLLTDVEMPFMGDFSKTIVYRMYEDSPGMVYYEIKPNTKSPNPVFAAEKEEENSFAERLGYTILGVGAGIGIAYLVGNNATGVGSLDDALIPTLADLMYAYFSKADLCGSF